MLELLAYATLYLTATVPPVCGVEMRGDVAHHFCNVEGPYSVTVTSQTRFRYGDKEYPAGTVTIWFVGPEEADYKAEPIQ